MKDKYGDRYIACCGLVAEARRGGNKGVGLACAQTDVFANTRLGDRQFFFFFLSVLVRHIRKA